MPPWPLSYARSLKVFTNRYNWMKPENPARREFLPSLFSKPGVKGSVLLLEAVDEPDWINPFTYVGSPVTFDRQRVPCGQSNIPKDFRGDICFDLAG
jgi:hypothetical protein